MQLPIFSFLFPSFHITFLFFWGILLFPPIALPGFEPRKGQIFFSFLSRIPDTGLTCILHLASSQLVKVKVELEEKLFIYSLPILLAVIEMGELRVEIPEELREEMKELPNVNWQLVVRRTLKRELEEILELKRIISKSKLTKEDVEELSDEINESLAKRFRESLKQR